MPSYIDPLPGWVDNLNGPVGLFYAAGKGVLRSMLMDKDGLLEFVPADTSINALLIAVKVLVSSPRAESIPVYHLTVNETRRMSMGDLYRMSKKVGYKYPVSWALW
jgi:fatty acyl-CoA reductase